MEMRCYCGVNFLIKIKNHPEPELFMEQSFT